MRVAQVISDYLPASRGGTQLHLRDLCRGLRSRRHEVEIFAGLRGDEFGAFESSETSVDGVRVTRVTYNFHDFDRFDRLFVHSAIDARFEDWLREQQPELVHFHHLSGLSTNMLALAKEHGLPVVLTLHDHWLVCPRGQRIHPETLTVCEDLDRSRCLPCLQRLWPHLLDGELAAYRLARFDEHVRRMLWQCDALITPSAFHRDRFVEAGAPADRCVAIEHGLDARVFEAARTTRENTGARCEAALPTDSAASEASTSRPFHVGFIGTVLPSKGVHVLVDAVVRLARNDVSLHIYGDIPPYHEDQNYGERLAAQADGIKCTFEGGYEHDDLASILAKLDLVVVPSIWWESFCLTIREAALAAVPVIASEHGAMAEAVDAGVALGFTPGDAEDLARVLARVLDDADLRAELANKAQLVRSLEDCVEETIGIYDRVRATTP